MSVMAEHSTDLEYHINFKNTIVLVRTTGYMDWLVKEACEIWLHA